MLKTLPAKELKWMKIHSGFAFLFTNSFTANSFSLIPTAAESPWSGSVILLSPLCTFWGSYEFCLFNHNVFAGWLIQPHSFILLFPQIFFCGGGGGGGVEGVALTTSHLHPHRCRLSVSHQPWSHQLNLCISCSLTSGLALDIQLLRVWWVRLLSSLTYQFIQHASCQGTFFLLQVVFATFACAYVWHLLASPVAAMLHCFF